MTYSYLDPLVNMNSLNAPVICMPHPLTPLGPGIPGTLRGLSVGIQPTM